MASRDRRVRIVRQHLCKDLGPGRVLGARSGVWSRQPSSGLGSSPGVIRPPTHHVRRRLARQHTIRLVPKDYRCVRRLDRRTHRRRTRLGLGRDGAKGLSGYPSSGVAARPAPDSGRMHVICHLQWTGAQPAVGPERTPPNSVDEADLMRGGGGHKLAALGQGFPARLGFSEGRRRGPRSNQPHQSSSATCSQLRYHGGPPTGTVGGPMNLAGDKPRMRHRKPTRWVTRY
jgi:hypothetical protein